MSDLMRFARFGDKWVACCACGFRTVPRYTFEAAGREYDLHLAEKFPIGTQRFPCASPKADTLKAP